MKWALSLTWALLLAAAVLWFLDNIDVFTPGSSFGSGEWPSLYIFLLGAAVTVVMLPMLYSSSLRHVVNHQRIWMLELATITVAAILAMFFQWGSDVYVFPVVPWILTITPLAIAFIAVATISSAKPLYTRYRIALKANAAILLVFFLAQWWFNVLSWTKAESYYLVLQLFG